MKFELELNLDTFNKETSKRLGVVFKEEFVREFLSNDTELLGYLAGKDVRSYDTYERDWLMESLTSKLIGMTIPLLGGTDEHYSLFISKWSQFVNTSDKVDMEKSKELLEAIEGN